VESTLLLGLWAVGSHHGELLELDSRLVDLLYGHCLFSFYDRLLLSAAYLLLHGGNKDDGC
jgi:hypothetical protein